MPAPYLLTNRAKSDLAEIVDYLAPRNAGTAMRFIQAARRDFAFLVGHPRAGAIRSPKSESLDGLRSWPIGGFRNYLIFYLPRKRNIEIVRVLHGARDIKTPMDED